MMNIAGMNEDIFEDALVELIRRTSSILPDDVREKLELMRNSEEPGSRARSTLDSILMNVKMAEESSRPICQDTGTVTFDIYHPQDVKKNDIEKVIERSVKRATLNNYLRPNVVDPLTGAAKADNIGAGHPATYYDQWDEDYVKIVLVLKGGGCENVGAQYSLPYMPLSAGRDMSGIKKVILHAVARANGKGCAPGVLGVGVGGDRAQSYMLSKKQLHRKLDDENPVPALAELEKWVEDEANTLGIGPMGFGGRTTLFGVKAAAMDRIPASYFVAITYMCWAYRRRTMIIRRGEVEYD